MSLSNWIRYGQPKQSTIAKSSCSILATATAATFATKRPYSARTVAAVASVSVATAEKRWFRFLDECLLLGVTIDEVQAEFNEQDTDDLLTEPDSKLPLHARTIAESILRDRQRDEIERLNALRCIDDASHDERVHRFTSTPAQTCGTCKHFERAEHPNLGHCGINAVSEAPCGLWDASGRDYCNGWEVR